MTDAALTSPSFTPATARRGGWRLRFAYALYRGATRLHWAEPELNGLGAVVRPGAVALDVGAALGMYSVPLAYFTGSRGRVDSFEPQLRGFLTVGMLRLLTGARRGVTRRLALGAAAGTGTIAVPFLRGFPIFGHGHISEGADDGDRRIHRSRTRIDTIDAWCARTGIEHVAFIKIDVEGFEPAVVEGARGVIDRDRPALLLEIEDRHLIRYGRDAAGFLDDVRDRWPEYRLHTWSGAEWIAVDTVIPEVRNYLLATPESFSS